MADIDTLSCLASVTINVYKQMYTLYIYTFKNNQPCFRLIGHSNLFQFVMKIKQVLIGGGTGFIGTALKNAFQNEAVRTLLVSRMPVPDSITWDDLNNRGIPQGTDAVINVSGQNVLDPLRRWTPGFRQNVISSRVQTNEMLSNAIKKCQHNPPKVFVTISGVGFYKADPSEEYNEESAGGEHDFLSRLCFEWEKASNVNSNKTRNVILRTGIVLGPNGGLIKEMYPFFYLGLGAKIGSGHQFMPWIHIEDLTKIFLRSVENDSFNGVINAVAPQVITNLEFTKSFAKVLWRPSFMTIPEYAIELMFGKERAIMMTKGQKVVSKRMNELGYKFKFNDIDTALNNIIKTKNDKN